MKKTKIVCSIGPSSNKYEIFKEMVLSGMNVARINFSHATIEERENVVKVVKEVREKSGLQIGILYDTKGPEFRNGIVIDGGIKLVPGNTIKIVKENVIGDNERFSVNHPTAIDSLEIGNIITKIDSKEIKVFEDLSNVLSEKKVGDKVTLTIKYVAGREYKEKNVKVTLS